MLPLASRVGVRLLGDTFHVKIGSDAEGAAFETFVGDTIMIGSDRLIAAVRRFVRGPTQSKEELSTRAESRRRVVVNCDLRRWQRSSKDWRREPVRRVA